MTHIAQTASELIGHTPLLELLNLEKKLRLESKIIVKLEAFNPGGSIKDRIALSMIDAAVLAGKLAPGGVIIEPTSGNTGIGLASIAASRGYKLIVIMPETMSVERRKLISAYGAKIILTPGKLGMKGAIDKAQELSTQIPGSIIAGQFINPANPEAHKKNTGPEIWNDTEGKIDFFVAGVGTGGTITGVGEYLKEKNPSIQIIAVEPAGSPVLSGGQPGPHKIQGIGAGFTPPVLNTGLLDKIIPVTDKDAMETARLIAHTEGILTGISGGAAAWAAIKIAKRNTGKMIVAIMPDSGERYLSTELYPDDAVYA